MCICGLSESNRLRSGSGEVCFCEGESGGRQKSNYKFLHSSSPSLRVRIGRNDKLTKEDA